MACLLSDGVVDGSDKAWSITGCPEDGFKSSVVYEDDSCLVVASISTPAIVALIKAPIQSNGTTNPVLMVDEEGKVIRRHGETETLFFYLAKLIVKKELSQR